MKIAVHDGKSTKIRLGLPNWLLSSRFVLKRFGIRMTAKQAWIFRKALKEYRKTHTDWVLVEVESADGESVQITC